MLRSIIHPRICLKNLGINTMIFIAQHFNYQYKDRSLL